MEGLVIDWMKNRSIFMTWINTQEDHQIWEQANDSYNCCTCVESSKLKEYRKKCSKPLWSQHLKLNTTVI